MIIAVSTQPYGELAEPDYNPTEDVEGFLRWMASVITVIHSAKERTSPENEAYQVTTSTFDRELGIEFMERLRVTKKAEIEYFFVGETHIEIQIKLTIKAEVSHMQDRFTFSYSLTTGQVTSAGHEQVGRKTR